MSNETMSKEYLHELLQVILDSYERTKNYKEKYASKLSVLRSRMAEAA